ncbi:interactor protein for cytohesin exchange factors 1 isoform X1 [Boleophthalmus pectinirostris]|uniref:interactor protein for cytohesin exchange factors 1 isoform X1 n=2 Tax=Boleophthalmus pectinirostris TaxID=150288 RepID=UPI00242BA640|nr:interactor protein for cytohesin exchange factors 1 isoform X1 [Boleophthalmus pectinirostris]
MFARIWSDFEQKCREKLQSLRLWWKAAFPISVSAPMAADDYNPVSLRHKSKKKTRGGNGTMSRRRISVKDLGQPDHQGWLYRKKESKGFLGIKWKKYWFVLKKTALYWYNNQLAEKAEGYIDLTNFMIDRAIECKKKHAFKACHPRVMMFYFAAESHDEMTLWLNKLGLASIHYEPAEQHTVAECYSEASDHEETETPEIPPPPYYEETLQDRVDASSPPGSTNQGTLPPPYSSTAPSEANGSLSTPVSTMTSQDSASSLVKQRQSWMDLVTQASPSTTETAIVCSVQVHTQHEEEEEQEEEAITPQPKAGSEAEGPENKEEPENTGNHEAEEDHMLSDELEKLYIHLKEASLSPIGDRKPSTKREFRASFIKRSKNHTVNDKLHLIRTLNSTLKSKEADLQVLEQLLMDPQLTAEKFREWKDANAPLMQEICCKSDQQGTPEDTNSETSEVSTSLVETSL